MAPGDKIPIPEGISPQQFQKDCWNQQQQVGQSIAQGMSGISTSGLCTPYSPRPCPTCGTCPTCGARTGFQTFTTTLYNK
jgi:hypothetical protein